MKRIFLTLSIVATVLLLVTFVLGWMIDDAGARESGSAVARHFLTGLGALVFACLVHAIVLTYFMGTARWIEETQKAYSLSDEYFTSCRRLKYRTILSMTGCLVMLVLTGAFGAMADPAAKTQFDGWFGISPALIHFGIAAATVTLNMMVNVNEYMAICRNSAIVEQVVAEVRRIRTERGLPT